MELVVLFLVLWLIGHAFPGSAGAAPIIGDALACTIAGAVVIGGFVCAYWLAAAGTLTAAKWLGADEDGWALAFAFFTPIAGPMLVATAVNIRRDVAAGCAVRS